MIMMCQRIGEEYHRHTNSGPSILLSVKEEEEEVFDSDQSKK